MKKLLAVVSVLMLLTGGFTLITGLVDVGFLASTGDSVFAEGLMVLSVVFFVAAGALDVLGGLLGLRAARNPAHSTGALVFGLLALAASAVPLALELTARSAFTCAVPLVYLLCAAVHRFRRS